MKKIRIRGEPWTESFMAEYEAAKIGPPQTSRSGVGVTPGTWGWLCSKYMSECIEYKMLDEKTSRPKRKRTLDSMCAEPIAPGSDRIFKNLPLARMTADDLEVLRDRKLESPDGADERVKAARAVTKWARKKRHIPTDFGKEVAYFRVATAGYHTWTLEEVEAYEDRWPIGTTARLALALLMFTGQRRSDVIRMGRQHLKKGVLTFPVFKGRQRKPKLIAIPALPALVEIIKASKCGDLTFLINELGNAFTDGGFGKKMRAWCDAAELPQCSAHGCRKAGATIAAENGATTKQLMAIFGWDSMQHAELYTRAADQKRLASEAMHLIAAVPLTGNDD
jgi:integrase